MLQFSIMLFLASNSPRRREMLDWLDVTYLANPAHIDETPLKGESPLDYVKRMSRTKALNASGVDHVSLGADTIVVLDDEILGKPDDEQDADRILKLLRGHRHQVHTALWLHRQEPGQDLLECCTSDVEMRNYLDEEIEEYINSSDPMDKAGAYAIQHTGFHPVVNFTGCMANVMGLPLCHLKRSLKVFGIEIEANMPKICLNRLQYSCTISNRILSGEQIG